LSLGSPFLCGGHGLEHSASARKQSPDITFLFSNDDKRTVQDKAINTAAEPSIDSFFIWTPLKNQAPLDSTVAPASEE
jgi:hypothetical protein